MKLNHIIGIALLVIGVVLLIVGMNASHSLADQVSRTFMGRFTEATIWYIVGGLALGAVGLAALFAPWRGRNA